MKKTYLLMSLAALLSFSAGAQGRMKAESVVQSSRLAKVPTALLNQSFRAEAPDTFYLNPKGERRNYDMSAIYVIGENGNTFTDKGYLQTVCYADDGAVYFNCLMPRVTYNNSWVKGQIEDKGDGQLFVKVGTPQLTSVADDGRKFYMVAMVKDALSGQWKTVDTCRFKLSDDRRSLEFVDYGSIWLMGIDSYGNVWEQDRGHKLVQFDDTIVQLPPQADARAYTFKYYDVVRPKETQSVISRVAFNGSDVYLKGLCPLFPYRWAKGHVSGNRIAVPSGQYMGPNGNYITYLFASTEVDGTLQPADSLYLTFNADTSVIKSSRNDYTLFGYSRDAVEYTTYNASYTKFDLVPAVPEDPVILDYRGDTLSFYLSALDVNGQPIDPSLLYYRVFINGSPYVFTKADYPSLSGDATDIPFQYIDFKDFYLTNYGEAYSTVLYPKEVVKTVGLQSVYVVDGKENTSEIVTLTVDGIASAEVAPAVGSVAYYDMAGRRVSAPGRGITIRQTRLANGRVRTDKIMR